MAGRISPEGQDPILLSSMKNSEGEKISGRQKCENDRELTHSPFRNPPSPFFRNINALAPAASITSICMQK